MTPPSIARVPLASRFGLLAAFTALAVGGCIATDDSEQIDQGLTVCHSTTVEGIDVSEFQGTINWSQVHSSGRVFAIARVGDGTYVDPQFARNWSGIRSAGMIRGAYLFFRPTDSAASQASLIASHVGTLGAGDLPVTIDVECLCSASAGTCSSGPGCVSASTAATVLRDLVSRVQTATGKSPMIYTGSWFWDGSSYFHDATNLGTHPLWVSGYTTGCVTVPSGWTDWKFWQYSDGTCAGCPARGTSVPGVPSSPSVDRDRFAGTLAQLQAFANGGAAWGGQFVAQSFPYASAGAINIHAGQSQSVWLDMKNIGTHAWDGNTRIGTTQPRDRVDLFAGAGWINSSRPASVPSGTTVASGSTHRFTWTFYVPASMAPGMHTEYFGMVEDGVTWFSASGEGGPPDNQLEAIINVLPPVVTDAGTPDAGHADAAMDASHDAARDGSQEGGLRDGSMDADAHVDAATDGDAHDGLSYGDGARDGDASGDGGREVMPAGCGCSTAGRTSARWPVGLLVAGLAFARLRRRRSRR